MPNLYPGIKPNSGSGRLYVLLFHCRIPSFFGLCTASYHQLFTLSGAVGSTVTISGSNFGANPYRDNRLFRIGKSNGDYRQHNIADRYGSPGTSYQPLTVTTGGLTVSSHNPLSTTFSDPGQFLPAPFRPSPDVSTGAGPQSIFTMDMDGDGKPDLVVANGGRENHGDLPEYKHYGSYFLCGCRSIILSPTGYYPCRTFGR